MYQSTKGVEVGKKLLNREKGGDLPRTNIVCCASLEMWCHKRKPMPHLASVNQKEFLKKKKKKTKGGGKRGAKGGGEHAKRRSLLEYLVPMH